MFELKNLEKTGEYFNLQKAILSSFVADRQLADAYNAILLLMFKAQKIKEGEEVKTENTVFLYKEDTVYERQYFNDPNLPYGDFTLREGLTKENDLRDIFKVLSGGIEEPDLMGFNFDNYKIALI